MSSPALEGLRIIEIGENVAAPFAAKVLADLGADVIKVERPGGDPLRSCGPFPDDIPDPERSALFHGLNAGKQGCVLDLESDTGREALLALVAEADLVIEDRGAGRLEACGLGFEVLAGVQPQLALVRISAFGQKGPYADWPVSDLVVQAAGGWVSGHGVPDASPVGVGGRLADFLTGSYAAAAALTAVLAARQQGRATHSDLSMMECLVGSLPYPMLHRHALESLGLPAPEVRYNPLPGILRCRDGWVGVNALTRPQWEMACVMLDTPEFVDRMDEIAESTELYQAFIAATAPWLSQQDAASVVLRARELRIPATPIGNGRTLLESEQLRARNFFVPGALGGYEEPGSPHRLSASPAPARRPAPRLDGRPPAFAPRSHPALGVAAASAPSGSRPLEGLRVLDLGAFWAAPYAAMYLAGLGADVTKIESPKRPDFFRFIATSLESGERWYECGPLFQATNLGKKGITLDLGTPRGRELFEALVVESDVVLENFSPRVMEQWGYDDAGLRRLRPDLIYVRTPGFGLEGPWRDALGWALVIEQAAGMSWLVGDPEEPAPRNPGGFFDTAVGMHLVIAIQAALAQRRRSGEGQQIEIAQLELGVSMTLESVIAYSMHGRIEERRANRSPEFAPQGVYATSDPDWIALSAREETQWQALLGILGSPEWAGDERFGSVASRVENASDLDRLLADEIAKHEAAGLAARLRAVGVPAAVPLVSSRMYDDPQLVARNYFQTLTHPVSGERRYPTWPMDTSFLPRAIHSAMAPTLGQHNEVILRERLGQDSTAIAALRSAGIIGERLQSA